MKRSFCFVLTILLLTVLTVGCSKGIKFPRVYSVNVTVTDGGEKMPEMLITFYPKQSLGNFSIQGETDASGSCKIQTIATGKKKVGAPAGDYVVTVERHLPKANDAEETKALEERAARENMSQGDYMDAIVNLSKEREKRNEELAAVVPEALRAQDTSPVSYTVSGKGELTIDLSQYE